MTKHLMTRATTRRATQVARYTFLIGLVTSTGLAQQQTTPPNPVQDLARQAQQRVREGREDEAVALARQAVEENPGSYQAYNTLGAMLDFDGKYAEAREAFQKAAEIAPTPDNKSRALRAIGISYGFEGNCDGVVKAEQPEYQRLLDVKDFYNAGEVANELARLCFDAGKLDVAEQWYRKGTDAGLQEPGIKSERTDLWHYRLEHALARIAAKRGNKVEAEKHVAAAKELLDRGNMPAQQKEYFPYLTGFVALYTGDYQKALTDLQQANQNDAYVLGLIAQTYEKLGQQGKAMEYYGKVLASTTHNPTTAGSRPLAKKKLGAMK
jgi:tetratricopeptide (TPR) repeat protein